MATANRKRQLWFVNVLLGMCLVTYISYLSLQTLSSGDSAWSRSAPRPCGAACSVEESPHFLIHTPGCVIPDIDPDHPSIAKYKGKPRELVCSKKRPLTRVEGLSLEFLEENLPDYNVSSMASLSCVYQGILRLQQDPKKYKQDCDKKFQLKNVVAVKEKKVPVAEDGIYVTCRNALNETVYKNVHYFLQPSRVRGKREQFQRKYGKRGRRPEQLSVVIMGTDAVARGNLRRHMPKTFRFLREEMDAIDLSGYIKVGDNTDPNMIAALMGMTPKELSEHECHPKKNSKYDDCPLIWKNFSEAGYVTAYAEDAAWMGVFHFNQPGYVKEPTDYYNRAFFLASEKYISHNGGLGSSNGRLCQGDKASIKVIHDYSLSVAEAFRDVPYFGFYWNAALTHDYLTNVAMADTPSLNYLRAFQEKGYDQHTILFFISDHGLRWGSFRGTYAGMLEERMPYLMAVFPPWFKEEYPEAWRNLGRNTKRLTSTFDLHATLADILNGAYADMSKTYRGKHGLSLFGKVPVNRTCDDASVPGHYCACEESTEADPRDPEVFRAAQAVVDHLNLGLRNFPLCAQLELDEVIAGRIGSARNSTKPKEGVVSLKTIMVTFQTNPGGARLEATVRSHEGRMELTAEASRTNKYGSQSHCIKDFLYRKYCFCKDLLTDSLER